jgi:tRNA threonylcarbamoyladenosine biosynthesis protein TsaB
VARAEGTSLAVLNATSLTATAAIASQSVSIWSERQMSLTTPCILAIDTASPSPAVSVRAGDAEYDEPLPAERQASERLLAAIEACLGRAGVRLADCERIAACSGPGSFTGVRVGLATAWGLSRAVGCALEPVSTLEVLAESTRGLAPAHVSGEAEVAAAMDAGRGEIVWQTFALSGARARATSEPARATAAAALEAASELSFVCVPANLLGGSARSVSPAEPLARVLARTVAKAPSAAAGGGLSAFYARPSAAQEKHGRP